MNPVVRALYNTICLLLISSIAISMPGETGSALSAPECIRALENRSEPDSSEVFAVARNGDYCAYPLRILRYHQVVNDHVGGAAVLVIFDRSGEAALAYDPIVDGHPLQFDASSRLHNMAAVKDRETGSRWSVMTGRCEFGALKGKRMYRLPASISTWRLWRRLHPDSWLLKEQGDQSSHYQIDPAVSATSSHTSNIESFKAHDIPWDRMVLGVCVDGEYEVFMMNMLNTGSGAFEFRLNGRRLVLLYDGSEHAAGIYIPEINGRLLTFSLVVKDHNTLFHDEQSHSVWSFDGQALSGALKGAALTPVVFIRCRWQTWSSAFPKSQIYRSYGKSIG